MRTKGGELSGGQVESDLTGTRVWSIPWKDFCSRCAGWWSRVRSDDPVYAVPETVIDELVRGTKGVGKQIRGRRPLLSPEKAEAERAFLAACLAYAPDTVGVWDGRPVQYPLFRKTASPRISEQLIRQMKWDEYVPIKSVNSGLEQLAEKADAVRRQQLGYAGAVTFDADYQAERTRLMGRWRLLPVPPPLPIWANTHDREPMVEAPGAGATEALSTDVAGFLNEAGAFLRKWQLASLVTWDLPLPQGPLESIPLGLARHLLGPGQIVNAYPTWYDIPSATNVRDEIRDQQRFAAEQAGVGTEHPLTHLSPRDGRASTPEAAFRMWFIESAVRGRYGARPGVTTRLDSAFAALFGVTTERVRQVRKHYGAFLNR
jgi:hypothetical protein